METSQRKLWLRPSAIYLLAPILCVTAFAFLIITIILTIGSFSYNWVLWLIEIIFFIALIYFLLIEKTTLTQMIISNQGIQCLWFKKEVANFTWADITEIKVSLKNAQPYLFFFTAKDQIKIEFNKKHYVAIMLICPDEKIKSKINHFDCLESFQTTNNA